MNFRVTRTTNSGRQNENQPCSEAVQAEAWVGARPESIWSVRFETLEELWSFVENYDPCVIGTTQYSLQPDGKGMPSLEIYDDYRE